MAKITIELPILAALKLRSLSADVKRGDPKAVEFADQLKREFGVTPENIQAYAPKNSHLHNRGRKS